MKKIIIGAALVLSLSACGTDSNTTDPETMDVSGIITEMEFETGSSSCTMNLFKAPGRPAPPAPAKPAPAKPAAPAPAKPPAGGATKPVTGGAKSAGGDVKPYKTYKSRSYVVYPIIGGSNRCYQTDCWEIEFQTADGQTFDVCVTEVIYRTYRVGDTFPKEG